MFAQITQKAWWSTEYYQGQGLLGDVTPPKKSSKKVAQFGQRAPWNAGIAECVKYFFKACTISK